MGSQLCFSERAAEGRIQPQVQQGGMAVCPWKGSSFTAGMEVAGLSLHKTRWSWEGETGYTGETGMPDLHVSSYGMTHLPFV